LLAHWITQTNAFDGKMPQKRVKRRFGDYYIHRDDLVFLARFLRYFT
jgi:hypothetical protein